MRQRFFVVLVGTCALAAVFAGARALTGWNCSSAGCRGGRRSRRRPRRRHADPRGRRDRPSRDASADPAGQRSRRDWLATDADWTDLGPTNIGGRVTDLVVDPCKPEHDLHRGRGRRHLEEHRRAASTFVDRLARRRPSRRSARSRAAPTGTLWAGTGEANPPGGGLTYFGDGIYRSDRRRRDVAEPGPDRQRLVRPHRRRPDEPERGSSPRPPGTVSTSVVAARHLPLDRRRQDVAARARAAERHDRRRRRRDRPDEPEHVFASLWDHNRNNGARTYGGVGSGLLPLDRTAATRGRGWRTSSARCRRTTRRRPA